MKKRWIIAISILAVLVIIGVFRHHYYYSRINSVKLPEGAETMKVQVTTTDVYGIHVCAEKIIGVRMSSDELREYVRENNADASTIGIFYIYKDIYKSGEERYSIEWDDYCIDPNCIKGREQEGMKYYVITKNTPYGSLVYN